MCIALVMALTTANKFYTVLTQEHQSPRLSLQYFFKYNYMRIEMSAPTALIKTPKEQHPSVANVSLSLADQDDVLVLESQDMEPNLTTIDQPIQEDTEMHIDEEGRPRFAPANFAESQPRVEVRKVAIPPHRMTPLKAVWPKIYPPLVEHLKLQVRMNIKNKAVELRTSKHTTDLGALQKGEDFVKAFSLGFDVDDAIALLRLDDLYIETFEIKDVKTLQGEHLSRAIGRIAGKDGKTKFAIENASRTRVVLADSKIHILGGFKNIHIAREAIVSLILGSPPSKVYGNLRTVASRMKERF
ncbi:Pre-rRNA-processing protein PNO1 [Erysiphe neolycopersici]|uniref:Pre-rRNA-processing protein PNO1 n=1 Tax=Erysiphe neolycopersici TaxID=212602 RepID=A0A420HXH2_9PEZI|nr:Pre-rRNA-processing protein PNO1 [Erysiphe neolycopersici]